MTTKSSVFSKAVTAVAALFSVAAVIIRAVLMTAYNGVEGFYTDKSLQVVFNCLLTALAVIVFATAYIYIKEEKNPFSLPDSRSLHIVSMVATCVFAGFIVYSLGKILIIRHASFSPASLLMTLFAVVALLYFVSYNAKIGEVRALLCSGSALVLLALVFGLYFDMSVSYINHSIVLCYAAAIFLMLATVAEANSYLGRPCLRRYLAFAPTAVVLSFALAIPDLIYAVANLSAPLTDIYYDVIILMLGVYHLVRLITIALTKPTAEEKEIKENEKTSGN
ncbi:MAG: hypothetical protein IJ002_00185 [Clostridia bacterium]|nr:hypothetical protein [Clostridia bacterium]